MKIGILISEMEFVVIALVSIFLVYEFYVSQNGLLRKLMIALFASMIFAIAVGGTYLVSLEYGYQLWSKGSVRVLTLLPLTIVMICLYMYISNQNKIKENE